MSQRHIVCIVTVLLAANFARAGIIGDSITGNFGHPPAPNFFYNSKATVQDPGEEFRGVAVDFGANGFVETFIDISEGFLRLGFDTSNALDHTSAFLNFRYELGDLDFGPGLRISDVTYNGNEGVGLFTGGGPASWNVSHTDDSILFENVTGWAGFPENQIIAVYEISVEAIPEPSTGLVALLGGSLFLLRRTRRAIC